jgi:hypothetical protein
VSFFLASYTAEHERPVGPTDLAGSCRGHCTLTRTFQTLGEVMAHQLQGIVGNTDAIQFITLYAEPLCHYMASQMGVIVIIVYCLSPYQAVEVYSVVRC